MIHIDILHLGGCPNRYTTAKRVGEALKELNVAAEVRELLVQYDLASSLMPKGSPTVLVNGIDIEPSSQVSTWTSLQWRRYHDGEKIEGAPSIALIRRAILDAGGSLSNTAKQ